MIREQLSDDTYATARETNVDAPIFDRFHARAIEAIRHYCFWAPYNLDYLGCVRDVVFNVVVTGQDDDDLLFRRWDQSSDDHCYAEHLGDEESMPRSYLWDAAQRAERVAEQRALQRSIQGRQAAAKRAAELATLAALKVKYPNG